MKKETQDLTDVKTHFEFGENWSEYSQKIDEKKIEFAKNELARLLATSDLTGKTFLDIGCGSGIHSLAAQKMGADIYATDIDINSVATTRKIIEIFGDIEKAKCEQKSVFELNPEQEGTFDVVYSWGVLHHTGDMKEAFNKASSMVKDGGLLVLAVYRQTPFCNFWKIEKRIYTKSSRLIRNIIAFIYKTLFMLGLIITKENPKKYIREYEKARGMVWANDVHDWLGGYPYESISVDDMKAFFANLGFNLEQEFVKPVGFLKSAFGSGCDEFIFRKTNA